MKTMRIGIDVGGTNTDAVIMQGRKVRAAFKSPTTADVGSGIRTALAEALRQAQADAADIAAVMIGTTHFTNAFVQGSSLAKVAVIRLAAPATSSLPPFADWPDRLHEVVAGPAWVVRGGYNYDGTEIAQPVREEILAAAQSIRAAGVRAVAISSVFAPVNDTQERFVRDIVLQVIPDAAVTLSHELGRIGLIERENAAIMNASLSGMAGGVVRSFGDALAALGIHCPLFVSQNDGTLMAPQIATRYPVLTFASGPTNSIRGGGFLTGLNDCIVVDIGGTTTDVGVLTRGLPRTSSIAVDIGGVRTNFRMPDVLSIGLGGGSRVRQDGKSISVGPDSVGFELRSEALVFGGSTLTATDIAVAVGFATVGDADAVRHLDPPLVHQCQQRIRTLIEDAIDRMKTSSSAVPIVLVGGGSILAPAALRGAAKVIVPPEAGVANAIGAAIAQVSGEVDQVYSYEQFGRATALERARNEATRKAIAAGADGATIQIADIEELPLQYLPGGAVRVRVKAVGELAALGV